MARLPFLVKIVGTGATAIALGILVWPFVTSIQKNLDASEPSAVTQTELAVSQGKALVLGKAPKTIHSGERLTLQVQDRVRTFTGAEATIFWPDGSLTRLGANTQVRIGESHVEKNTVQISLELEKGKTWSNVVSYLQNGSYFKQTVTRQRVVATVRGTAFAMDSEADYVYADKHQVDLTDQTTGKSYTVAEGNALKLSNLIESVTTAVDTAWKTLNARQDVAYLRERAENAMNSLKAKFGSGWINLQSVQTSLQNLANKGGTMSVTDLQTAIMQAVSTKDTKSLNALVQDLQTAVMKGSFDAATLGSLNTTLLQTYSSVHASEDTATNLETKAALRDAVVASAPDDTSRKQYVDDFARFALYDSLAASKQGYSSLAKSINTQVEAYIASGYVGSDVVENLKKGLSTADLAKFGSSLTDIKERANTIAKTLGNTDIATIRNLLNSVDTSDTAEQFKTRLNELKNQIPTERLSELATQGSGIWEQIKTALQNLRQ